MKSGMRGQEISTGMTQLRKVVLKKVFANALKQSGLLVCFVSFFFSKHAFVSGVNHYLFETICDSLESKPWTPMKKSRLKIFNFVRSKYLTNKKKITA